MCHGNTCIGRGFAALGCVLPRKGGNASVTLTRPVLRIAGRRTRRDDRREHGHAASADNARAGRDGRRETALRDGKETSMAIESVNPATGELLERFQAM